MLQPQNVAAQELVSRALIWPSVFLFVCLGLLAIVKSQGASRLTRIVKSTFSPQLLQQLEREEMGSNKMHALGLNIFFTLNLSFLIYKINVFYPFALQESSGFAQYSFFTIILFVMSALKDFVNKTLAFFTDEQKLFTVYAVNSTLVNQTFGIFLFPWIVFLEFTNFDPLFFISGASVVLFTAVLLKWYRGTIMSLVNERIGLLQTFSYFCGLEILPLLVMAKFLIETF